MSLDETTDVAGGLSSGDLKFEWATPTIVWEASAANSDEYFAVTEPGTTATGTCALPKECAENDPLWLEAKKFPYGTVPCLYIGLDARESIDCLRSSCGKHEMFFAWLGISGPDHERW